MNAYKLNGMAGSMLRIAICNYFKIAFPDIYKKVKSMDIKNSTITIDNGDVYKLTLIKTKNEINTPKKS